MSLGNNNTKNKY